MFTHLLMLILHIFLSRKYALGTLVGYSSVTKDMAANKMNKVHTVLGILYYGATDQKIS